MRGLLAHAAQLGVTVHVAHLPGQYRGVYDHENRRVVYDFDLTPIERRCVLAHELGHAFYGHQCYRHGPSEAAADEYAAQLLVDPAAYARLERIGLPADEIAEELRVTLEVLEVFARTALTKVRGVTYTSARLGFGMYRHAGFHSP